MWHIKDISRKIFLCQDYSTTNNEKKAVSFASRTLARAFFIEFFKNNKYCEYNFNFVETLKK